MNTVLEQRILQALRACKQERDDGYEADAFIEKDCIVINTRMSHDRSKSHNGGDYDFWLVIQRMQVGISIQEQCSCDFWQPMPEPEMYDDVLFSDVRMFVICAAEFNDIPIP